MCNGECRDCDNLGDCEEGYNRKTIAPKRVPVWRVWLRLLDDPRRCSHDLAR